MKTKILALTIGDSEGIGPEITARFLSRWEHGLNNDTDISLITSKAKLVVYGNIHALQKMAKVLGIALPKASTELRYEPITADSPELSKQAQCGQVSYKSLVAAVKAMGQGQIDALVTGPISKENLYAAGIPYEGHTEILQDLAREYYPEPSSGEAYQSDMLFLYQQFRMLLLTRHVPLSKVGAVMTLDGVIRSVKTLCQFLIEYVKIERPKIAILGVNPHAGENMGKGRSHDSTEEARILKPAIQEIQRLFPSVEMTQPLAADGVFRGFQLKNPPYDAYVAAYHDQGLIPFKLLAGLQAVNVTIGLPFIRTSVSHGTAPDIAGKGIASEESLIAAYQAALELISE